MKLIRVTMTIDFPEDRLTPAERADLQPQFEQMKQEIMREAPDGTSVTFGIEFIDA